MTIVMMPSNLSLGLGRPLNPLLSTDIQIRRTDELEVRLVLNSLGTSLAELVAVYQLGEKDLDGLQHITVTNAHTLTGSEGNESALGDVGLVTEPAVRVEASWVVPGLGVVVDVPSLGNHDGVLGEFVGAGQDTVNLGCSCRLK